MEMNSCFVARNKVILLLGAENYKTGIYLETSPLLQFTSDLLEACFFLQS